MSLGWRFQQVAEHALEFGVFRWIGFSHVSTLGSAEAGFLDSRDMDKHILAAVLRLDKPVPFLRVEPLHGAERHCLISTVDVLRYRCELGLTIGLVEPGMGVCCGCCALARRADNVRYLKRLVA